VSRHLPRCRPIKLDWYEWWLIETYRALPAAERDRLIDFARQCVRPIHERAAEAERLVRYQRAVAVIEERVRLRRERRPSGMDGRSRARKHPGTGMVDTPQETWDAMRAADEKGDEPMTDIAKRFGVIYSAAHTMMWRWYRERADRERHEPAPGNVIRFPLQ
jgi:hypothetical protein